MLSAITNSDIALIVAMVLFCLAGVMTLMSRSFEIALIAFGLAIFSFAFVITAATTI